jgi:hypothetical protein
MIRADSNTRRTSSGSAQAESVRALYDLGPDWRRVASAVYRRTWDVRVRGAARPTTPDLVPDPRTRPKRSRARAGARGRAGRRNSHARPGRGTNCTHGHRPYFESPHAPRHAPRRSACATGLHGRTRQTTETYDTLPRRRLLPRTVISPQPSHSHCTARNEEARRRNPCNSCNRTPDSRNASYYDSPLSCRCPL